MAKVFKYIRYLDLVTALGAVAWGIYQHNAWWLAGGLVGLVVAWLGPAERVNNLVRSRVTRRASFPLDLSPVEAVTPSLPPARLEFTRPYAQRRPLHVKFCASCNDYSPQLRRTLRVLKGTR